MKHKTILQTISVGILLIVLSLVISNTHEFQTHATNVEDTIYVLNDSKVPEANTETTYAKIIEERVSLSQETENIEETKQVYSVPTNNGFKSYMYYTAITSTNSLQYKLQRMAYTGNYGIRMVNERYCVAVGTAFGMQVGQCFDLVLQNGTVIPCVLADVKADGDTDSSNIFTGNGCCSEFLVDKEAFSSSARRMGDVSYCTNEWQSPVVWVHVYKEFVW